MSAHAQPPADDSAQSAATDIATPVGRRRSTVTVAHVVVACIPVLLIIVTPLFPFANEPGLILGIPTMIVWMAALVVAIVVILQIIDRQITRREEALATTADRMTGVDVDGGPVAGGNFAGGTTIAGREDEA